MKAAIVKIGNSRGIRIPKVVLEQCMLEDEVDMEVLNRKLVICPSTQPREGWAEACQAMAKQSDDLLLEHAEKMDPKWDDEEWVWD